MNVEAPGRLRADHGEKVKPLVMPRQRRARLLASGLAVVMGMVPSQYEASAAAPPASGEAETTDASRRGDANAPPGTMATSSAQSPDATLDEAPPDELANDPAAMARYWFARGNDDALAGRHAAAARAFARSAAALPTREAYYNEALAHELAGEPELAIVAFESYLGLDLAERGLPPDAADVRARLTRLEALVGWVVVRVPPGEAFVDVRVDDVSVDPRLRTDARDGGGEMVMSLHLRAGLHRLRFVRADASSLERVVDVAGGERHELRLADDEAVDTSGAGARGGDDANGGSTGATGGPAGDDDGKGEAGGGRRIARNLAITSGAVTGASLALTVTFAGLTLDAKRDFEAALCDGACTDGERYPYDDERRFERNRTATNVLAGVTAGLAAVTVIVATLAARDVGEDRERRRRRNQAEASLRSSSLEGIARDRRGTRTRPGPLRIELGDGLRVRF